MPKYWVSASVGVDLVVDADDPDEAAEEARSQLENRHDGDCYVEVLRISETVEAT
jgi:hypothetical protein